MMSPELMAMIDASQRQTMGRQAQGDAAAAIDRARQAQIDRVGQAQAQQEIAAQQQPAAGPNDYLAFSGFGGPPSGEGDNGIFSGSDLVRNSASAFVLDPVLQYANSLVGTMTPPSEASKMGPPPGALGRPDYIPPDFAMRFHQQPSSPGRPGTPGEAMSRPQTGRLPEDVARIVQSGQSPELSAVLDRILGWSR